MGGNRTKKIIIRIIIVLSILFCIGFATNWYMSRRLNNFLNKTVSERISQASGGFYKFTFDNFSVGFFNGELSINGIKLRPDSTVYAHWSSIDSLPQTYIELDIATVDFKGLNFKWRINYKYLHFDVFEVKSPHIKVFDINRSRQYRSEPNKYEKKNLYEAISPYIDVVTVKKMNLENAHISYIIKDSITTTVYKLNDADFHAYGFKLDENSFQTGKLLYCDNFDFSAVKPQTLLSNGQIKLTTNKISLNTKDSMILIDNVNFISNQAYEKADDNVNARIKTIGLKGIDFNRRNTLTYLRVRSFDILSSDIYYTQSAQNKSKNKIFKQRQIAKADSILHHWSLYDITSPLLHSIIIDKIAIENASFHYKIRNAKGTDIYVLDNFDFVANNIKIDSVTNSINRFRHANSFILNATGIKGYVPSKNHEFRIKNMQLNTLKQYFRIENLSLKSITEKNHSDYFFSTIEKVNFEGLKIEKGIDAELLTVNNPKFRYIQKTKKKTERNIASYSNGSYQNDAAKIIEPFINHLSIRKVRLKNAEATYNNITTADKFSLSGFDFFATNFKINDTTRLTKKYFFSCDNFTLRFANFDNLFRDKSYRLTIKKGIISGTTCRINLQGVELIPQLTSIPPSNPQVYIKTPTINVDNITYGFNTIGLDKNLDIGNIMIEKPFMTYIYPKKKKQSSEKDNISTNRHTPYLNKINIASLNIEYPQLIFVENTKDSTRIQLSRLLIHNLYFQPLNLKLDDLNILKPAIQTRQSYIDGLFHADGFNLEGLDWYLGKNSSLTLKNLKLSTPTLLYHTTFNKKVSKQNEKEQPKDDIYSILSNKLADRIAVTNTAVTNANINYLNTTENDTLMHQKVNKTEMKFTNLNIEAKKKAISFDNLLFKTNNLRFPLSGGFYTMDIDKLNINQSDSLLQIEGINLLPAYPKKEFAYKHPKHKDWFDAGAQNIFVSGLDFKRYFTDKELWIKDIQIRNAKLKNYKNQQIEIEHHKMPLIYEGIQKAPIKFHVNNIDVSNFEITYEELAPKGTYPGIIKFHPINGNIKSLSNIPQYAGQYTRIDANGVFMDNIPFTATWTIPIDTLNDCFCIKAHINKFDIRQLNQIIMPLGGAEIKKGEANDVKFDIQASGKEATIDMQLLYNNLEISILNNQQPGTYNKFATTLANMIIRNNNPNNAKDKPRISQQLHVTRDPYHSTFNYMWQILRPAATEAVGISGKNQKLAGGFTRIIRKVKKFFSFGKKKKDTGTASDKDNSNTVE